MVIAKIDDELPCHEYHNTLDDRHISAQYVGTILNSLTIMMSTCILIIHLLFKMLRTSLFGKLLIFYNLGVMFISGSILALLLMHYWIKVNSQPICHTTTIIFTLAVVDVEVVGPTCYII